MISKIVCGHNVQVLKKVRPEVFDLVITSPPYANLRTYKGYDFDFDGIVKELYRTLKSGGVIVWVVGDATKDGTELLIPFKQAIEFSNNGFMVHDTMIFEKSTCAFPDSMRYYNVFEYMFIFSKGRPKTFKPIKDRKNITGGIQIVHGKERNRKDEKKDRACLGNVTQEFGVRWNIWRYRVGSHVATDKIAFQHPAIFPEQLVEDHLKSWSNPGDLVLDPFCGSGTVPKMCLLNDRDFLGIEISPEYCKIAEERIAQYRGCSTSKIF